MYFNQFRKKLSGEKITEQLRCYDHLIQKDENGTVFIGNAKTKFTELEEARSIYDSINVSVTLTS